MNFVYNTIPALRLGFEIF